LALSKPRIHPYLGLALGVLAVSAASIFIKSAQDTGVPSLVIAAYRLTLAALVLIPFALWRYHAELDRLTRSDLAWAGLTGLFLGLHFATWITSLEYTSIASSSVLVTTTPIFVGLFSAVVWKEKLGGMMIGGLVLTTLGAGLVALADVCTVTAGGPVTAGGLSCPPLSSFLAGRAFIGDLLALVGAIAFAGNILIGRRLRAKLSLVPYITLGYSAAALTLLVAVLVSGLSLFGYQPIAYVWMGLLALFPQLIGHSALNWALGYLSATYISIAVLGEPIGSTILAFFVFRQTPTLLKLLGGGLILLGILLASKPAPKTSEV
jgi:drug/metabolite transporter (DMT)-like permease